MASKRHTLSLFLKRHEQCYCFLKTKQNNDGSVECIFPYLAPSRKNISQRLILSKDSTSNMFHSQVIEEQPTVSTDEKTTYISYHTSGQVNYHRMSFSSIYCEPLFSITHVNPFFILSFQNMDCFRMLTNEEIEKAKGVVVDISSLSDERIDIVFSIAPCESQFDESNSRIVSVSYGKLLRLMLEFIRDKDIFCFSDHYEPCDCVKLQIHNSLFSEPTYTKGQALIKYVQKIYNTNDVVITAPNSEGIIKLFFSVEMRRRPFVKIEFVNPNQRIDRISKETYWLQFKVFDERKHCHVKNAEEIQIKSVILDAEIYDNEKTPPEGWL